MNSNSKEEQHGRRKILLALLPFWSPMIPPIGIAALKSYLVPRGFRVKTADVSILEEFKELYENYFQVLRENVPADKRGNFYSIGHDVLRNQMMAHMNRENEEEYLRLVKILVSKTFYVEMEDIQISRLAAVVTDVYARLEDYFLRLLETEKPSVLGLSVYSDTLPASLFAFKLTREHYPHIQTYMGGGVFADQLALKSPDLTRFLEETAGYIDKVVIGEGEILFLKLLRGELPVSQRLFTLDDIDRRIVDLRTVDILDLSDFNITDYPYNISYTSRSCPFQCSFCSETIQWGKYRKKTAGKIVEEVGQLYEKHGYPLFLFSDSLLNPVIEDVADEFLTSEPVLYWEGWLRVDKHSRDRAKTLKWRRSGFYHARLGIESASPRVLNLMDKRITVEDAKESIRALAHAGIKTTTLWVVGHPGETEADFQDTLDFLEELKYDIYEAECRPFYYYLDGQAGTSGEGWGKFKPIPLYPRITENMLLFQTWILDCEPSREVTYQRVNRFVDHCNKLGIPNPYSMSDIYEADERWKKLQRNAVPSLVEFKSNAGHIDECRKVKELMTLDAGPDVGDFQF